jgi:hypothetical protein
MEEGREGGREEGREGGREGGRERGREGRTYVVELGDVVGSAVVLVLGRGDLAIGL